MNTFELSKKVLPLALVATMGAAACSSHRSGDTVSPKHPTAANCPSKDGMTDFRLIGGSKEGGTNAINSGECVAVYDRNTLQTIGYIAHNQAFDIVCVEEPKPVAYRVEIADSRQGDVNLNTAHAASMAKITTSLEIPNC